MDLNSIMTAIGSLGFPIVMCLTMFFYMNKQTQVHKEEIDNMTEALNNNTLALNKLWSKIDGGKHE